MFWGGRSLRHVAAGDAFSPRASKKYSKKKNNNPYSSTSRGLDKFSVVLAQLKLRKEKIMAKNGQKGAVSDAEFTDSSTNEFCKPAIASTVKEPEVEDAGIPDDQPVKLSKESALESSECCWGWSMVVMLVLACLVAFGKVFAICCTCMWLYWVGLVCSGTRVAIGSVPGRFQVGLDSTRMSKIPIFMLPRPHISQ